MSHWKVGILDIEVFEDNVPPRFRLRTDTDILPAASDVTVETIRPDGRRQLFTFEARDGYLESRDEIPEPHAFVARIRLMQAGHAEVRELKFEEHDHAHGHGVARITATTTCGPPSFMSWPMPRSRFW